MQLPWSQNSGNSMRTRNKSSGPDTSYTGKTMQKSAYDGAQKAFNALTRTDPGKDAITNPPLKPAFREYA